MARQDEAVQRAELVMIEAWQLLMRLPDRERGFLKSGSRSCLPAPIREWLGMADAELALDLGLALPEAERAPLRQLGRREMELVERAWFRTGCLAEAPLPQHRGLFAMVIATKAGRMPGGFKWEDIGKRLYGKAWGTARCDMTTDRLRSRFEASLGRVAVRLMVLEGELAG